MIYKDLQTKLVEYTMDCENPDTNFNLAVEYEKLKQYASAVSLYLRTSERTNNKTLQYECLLRAGLCFRRQGDRLVSEKSCWQNAIYLLPNRPEAYLFMAQTFNKYNQNHTAITYLCIGEMFAFRQNELENFRVSLAEDYGGLVEFKVQKYMLAKKCGINFLTEDLKFMATMTF
jgi:tetratricopeptide (TPR) repeat protein